MTSLLERRQQALVKSLKKRKEVAQAYIDKHKAKLDEKLQPYYSEIKIVDKMLEDYTRDNPEIPLENVGELSDVTLEGTAINA